MKWISVDDRLPVIPTGITYIEVIALDGADRVFNCWFENGEFWDDYKGTIDLISHWIPLPESPK